MDRPNEAANVPIESPTSPGNSDSFRMAMFDGIKGSSQTLKVYRGILIICIVVGHSRLLTSNLPGLHHFLYSWHVHGFFFAALAAWGLDQGTLRARDVVIRFGVPFVLFTLAATAVAAIATGEVWARLSHAALFLITGAAMEGELAFGIQLYWFLPAYVLYILMLRASSKTKIFSGVAIQLAIPLLIWIAVFALTIQMPFPLPWNLAIAAYMAAFSLMLFPLAYGILTDRGPGAWLIAVICGLIAIGLTSRIVSQGINVALFSFGEGAGPIVLGISYAILVNAVVLAISTALTQSRILAFIGQNSLYIYLFHIFVTFAFWEVAKHALPLGQVLLGSASVVVAIGTSIVIAEFFKRNPLVAKLVFPRGANDLTSIWRPGGIGVKL